MVSKLQRVTQLKSPVVQGEYYLVPTVRYEYCGKVRDWPVFLPRHADVEFFNFADHHYHVDPRFLSKRDFDGVSSPRRDGFAQCQASPLAIRTWKSGESEPVPHPPVIWKRRRCARPVVPYRYGDQKEVVALCAAYAGQQCADSGGGWICPHQHFAMGSVSVDESGVQTCPLHGLKIDAASGVVL